ncbi:MAG: DUF3667 domain-containing protein [Cryomorphaceae bacterium]
MEDLPKLKDDDKVTVNKSKVIERFTFSSLSKQVMQFFYLEKGFLKTIKLLVVNPGKHIKAYLSTDRDRLVNPFKFYLVIGTIYAILFRPEDVHEQATDLELERVMFEAVATYYHFAILVIVFFIAIYAHWFFRKESGYNRVEMLILHLYIMSILFLISIITYPLIGFYKPYGSIFMNFILGSFFLYAYISFFKGKYPRTIVKTLLIIVCGLVTIRLIVFGSGLFIGIVEGVIKEL